MERLSATSVVKDSFDREVQDTVEKTQYSRKNARGRTLFSLALASLGIVYGDIGTSPLYVLSSVFSEQSKGPDDNYILGVCSTIFWTITLMVLVKYIWITLAVDDHGEGGVFALFSIIKRKTREKQTDFGIVNETTSMSFLKKHKIARKIVLGMVILCAALTMSDGVLTPAISTLSAAEGLQFHTNISHELVIIITIGILTILFSIQRFGTRYVGLAFGPVTFIWFMFNFAIGIFNITKNPSVFRSISPHYMYYYWSCLGFYNGLKTLGSIFLCITGVEALYADMGHLNALSIRLSFATVVYPSLIVTYLGQTSVILENYDTASAIYWKSVPAPLVWPSIIIATLATIIASQALITGTFTVVKQSIHANTLPRLNVVQTNPDHDGQIYIPSVNFILYVLNVLVVLIFQSSLKLAHAYGFAIALVIFLTHILFSVVMNERFNKYFTFVFSFSFGILSLIFTISTSMKIPSGGWFSILLGTIVSVISFVWHRGQRMKINYIKKNKVSSKNLFSVAETTQNNVVLYNELSSGVIPAYKTITDMINISGSKNVILHVRRVPIPRVADSKRFLVSFENNVYMVVARYGYSDVIKHNTEFCRRLCKEINSNSSDVVFVCNDTNITTDKNIINKMILYIYSLLKNMNLDVSKSFGIDPNKTIFFKSTYRV